MMDNAVYKNPLVGHKILLVKCFIAIYIDKHNFK
jgi:hypothetical protein